MQSSMTNIKNKYKEALSKGQRIDRLIRTRTASEGIYDTSMGGGESTFLTQRGATHNDIKKEIEELEHLLAGASQV